MLLEERYTKPAIGTETMKGPPAVPFGSDLLFRGTCVCLLIAFSCSSSAALDHDRAVAQLAHRVWTAKEGAPSGPNALAQTKDGFLWAGTARGLYRFDGTHFELYQPPSGAEFPARDIRSLFASPDGKLWIGFRNAGASVLQDGRNTNYGAPDGLPGGSVNGFAQDREGTIWVAASKGLARLEGGRWKEIGKDWNYPGKSAQALFVDHKGTLWVATEESLVFLPQGSRKFELTGDYHGGRVAKIAESSGGSVEGMRFGRCEKSGGNDEGVISEDFKGIVGSSDSLLEVLDLVREVAPTDSTVLIEGETGTGKELIAQAVHNISARCGRPFVKLNCSAIPFDLLESELFGHEKGAFTGAVAQKIGRFEMADTGTLFLDEIGDLPLALQPKLLRVLQEQEFERLGSGRTHRINVRLVAATHRDLAEMGREERVPQ